MRRKLVARSIIRVIRRNIGLDALLLLSAGGVVVLSLIPPQILKNIIDRNLIPGQYDQLSTLAVVYMGILLLIGVFDFLKEAVLTVSGQKITREIRLTMMGKLERINARYFSSQETGTVVSRFTNDVDAINSMFTSGIIGMAIDLMKVIGIVFSIWSFSAVLGSLTLCLLPVIYGLTRFFQKRMLQSQLRNRVLVGQVNNHISESVKSIRMIKSFSKEDYMEQRYKGYLEENYQTMDRINFFDSIFSPLIQMMRAIVIALIVVLSASQLRLAGLSLGMVAAAIELVSNLFAPIESLGMELQNIQQAVSGIRRVNEFDDEPEDEAKDMTLKAGSLIPDPGQVALSFQDMSFRYEAETAVLDHISLDLKPQEKVAFVGRTGVGKSTLFKLIMGLIAPTSGCITINGTDVSRIPNPEKRRIFGYVEQDFHLIQGSVADQVSLQDPSLTRAQIEQALDTVGLGDYVASLPQGCDTSVSHDTVFSQGQRQLLAIARAIVTHPPILLLDEITANLDAITEARVVDALQKAGRYHTLLSISHRLSAMIASDMIVILENGRVKNAGAPEDLLQQDEWYRSHIALEKLTWH